MLDNYQRQIELEQSYSNESIAASQKQILDLMSQGRAADLSQGKVLLAKAFSTTLDDFNKDMEQPHRGVNGSAHGLLRRVNPEILVMAALREVFNSCANPLPVRLQDILGRLGKVIETEALLSVLNTVSPEYTDKTIQYLDKCGTKSVSHRYRTFASGADSLKIDWQRWTVDERIRTAKILLSIVYESTGLFKWEKDDQGTYIIKPKEHLSKYLIDIQEAAKAIVKYPPMLIKPMDWVNQFEGGYLTDWFRLRSPMCTIRTSSRDERNWVIKGLGSDAASPVRAAMNKAQSTPYRVNKEVLNTLRQALAMQGGVCGLPNHKPDPKPVFPFPESWLKESATEEDLDQFKLWKNQMSVWYTKEATRAGKHTGLLGATRELVKYQDEESLYFPAFIDWRGRLYFRSIINPQSNDAIKGCLEFAEGKPLGSEGLFWLKVHVANCCGYDKHKFHMRVQWVDENYDMIMAFINDPLNVDPPEADTAFTLLQAGIALQEAINSGNPESYVCHVPVAMDATCSGLQHFSALTRDSTGALFTNLLNNNTDQKSDIYKQVGTLAEQHRNNFTDSPVIKDYWDNNEITRSMSKKPVMTFVYGSTLISNIDSLCLEMANSGMDCIRDPESGKIVYSLNKLATPIAKALRLGVVQTVPMADEMMRYLRKLVGASNNCLRWVTPVGVPVSNWTETQEVKKITIASMGITSVRFTRVSNEYNKRAAANGISPNFVHSMDSAHLCSTILTYHGNILPIHDSFGTHPSDVRDMLNCIRNSFVDMYLNYNFNKFLEFNNIDEEKYPVPLQGTLDLECVRESEFMFC